MTEPTSDQYHEGELAVQRRAGVRQRAAELAAMVDSTVPDDDDVHDLVASQPHAVVTSLDRNGAVWVSFLTGEPGFISVEDPTTVRFGAEPVPGDPLAAHLRPEMPVGVLLVDPRTRNRLRVNGVAEPTAGGFEVRTEEVFPNCPKYIQERSFEAVADQPEPTRTAREDLAEHQGEWIETADTFFIGSYHPETGADASHRGGDPGFVTVEDGTIVYPDYPGNSMFCTLGNVHADSRVGLLFVDFADGDVLQISGHANIVWDEARVAAHDGAERLVEIVPARVVELEDGHPLRWSFEERSPFNP